MPLSKSQVETYIIADLSRQFSLPPTYFKAGDNLRTKWLFTDAAMWDWGKHLNAAQWWNGFITPLEMIGCKTIGDVVNLIHGSQAAAASPAGARRATRKPSKRGPGQ